MFENIPHWSVCMFTIEVSSLEAERQRLEALRQQALEEAELIKSQQTPSFLTCYHVFILFAPLLGWEGSSRRGGLFGPKTGFSDLLMHSWHFSSFLFWRKPASREKRLK